MQTQQRNYAESFTSSSQKPKQKTVHSDFIVLHTLHKVCDKVVHEKKNEKRWMNTTERKYGLIFAHIFAALIRMGGTLFFCFFALVATGKAENPSTTTFPSP